MKKRFMCLLLVVAMMAIALPAFADDDPLGLYDHVMNSTGGWTSAYKYEEPITVTSVLGLGSTVWYEEGQDSEYNVWMMQVLAEMGVNVDYLWVVNDQEFQTKLNLSIGSGDIPDFFRVNSTQLTNLVEEELILDQTALYEQYGSDFLKATIAEDPFAIESATFDGKLMALPQPGAPYMAGGKSMYIRTDWLANLGAEVPTTVEDLNALMYAFSNNDPDGNGQDDTVGFYLDNKLGSVAPYANMYGQYPDIWRLDADGKAEWGGVAAGMKDVLAELAKLYADGVIDPEFAVKDGSAAGEDIAAGMHGMMFSDWIAGYGTMQYSIANSETADWEAYPVASATGEPAKMSSPFSTGTYWVVNKDCEHPEIVIQLANYYLERGYENKMDLIEPLTDPSLHGLMHAYFSFSYEPAYKNLDIQQRLYRWKETGDDSELWPDDKENYAVQETFFTSRDTTGFAVKATFGPYDSGLGMVQYYIDNNLFEGDIFTAADTEGMVEYWGTLEALQEEYYSKIIVDGGANTEALWNEFVQKWYAAGGDIVTDEVNEWYANK